MKFNWFISEDGKKFLQAVLCSKNLQLFCNDTIIFSVDYLYKRYKSGILLYRLPMYLLKVAAFLATVLVNES